MEGSRSAVVAAFVANLAIAVAKFVGFLFKGAASLMAEAVHSVADTGNQGLLLLGGQPRHRRPAGGHRGGARYRDQEPADRRGRRLIHMRTEHLGPGELLVGAKIELDPHLTAGEVVEAIDRTAEHLRIAVPAARVVYLEPDLYRGVPG